METHFTFIFYTVHGEFIHKSYFYFAQSSCTVFYPQQVNMMEIHLWWENAHIVLIQILELSHENLSPIGYQGNQTS